MGYKRINEYQPDYVVAPGEILREHMEAFGWTVADVCAVIGLCRDDIEGVLSVEKQIDEGIADRLAMLVTYPGRMWLSLEELYQEDKTRLA